MVPTAVLWVAVLAAFGAVAFAADTPSPSAPSCRDRVSTLLVAGGCSGHNILVWREFPVFRILYMKGVVRGAAALREVELVLARAGQGQPDRLRSRRRAGG